MAYAYQWSAAAVNISGATGSTYTLATTDQAKAMKVTVSFTDDAGNAESLTSAATGPVAAAPTTNNQASGQPTISGTSTVGNTLTAGTSSISDADGMNDAVFAYQWLRADVAITGATSSTYTLVSKDQGNAIKVRVSFTGDGGFNERLTSASVTIPAPLESFFDTGTVPTGHDGSNAFTFQVYFTEEPDLGFRKMRDHVLTVTNGNVHVAKRTNPDGPKRTSGGRSPCSPPGTPR